MKVAWIENPRTPKHSGVWRYNQMVRRELEKLDEVELTTEATTGREVPPLEVKQDGKVVKIEYVPERPARYPWVPMWFKYFVKNIVRDNLRRVWHRIAAISLVDLKFLLPPDMLDPYDGQLVHLTDQYLAAGISYIRPRSLIITVHDIIPHIMERDYNINLYEKKFHRFLFHVAMRNLHKATAIIADSHYTKESLAEVHPKLANRIHVVHLGVAHERFTPDAVEDGFLENAGIKPKQPYIVHISNESPHKNFRALLKAFSKVHAERPDVLLVKLGRAHNADHHQETVDLIKTLGIKDVVKFVEEVTDADVVNWYRGASVMVMPSLAEGFGLPVLEAMACGTPVVSSDAETLVEIAGDAAIIVPRMDEDAYTQAILKVLNNPDVARDMVEKGLEHVKKFTWENTARGIMDVYQSVAAAQ
jgi:glycosyltransferase involved in cell wall biosynthesis